MSYVLLVGLSGCQLGRGQTDLLQARLREQQQVLAETQTKLAATSRDLKLARKESDGLRQQLANAGAPGLLPEQADLLIRASAIRINSMLTAGFDRDETYGDDTLAVQFVPVDDQGEVVRLPGNVQIRVIDPKLPAASQTVAEWKFSASESQDHWVKGFLGTGYQFTLPWPEPPKNSELVVHVQLKPADGRDFTATHIVKITPPVVTADGASTPRMNAQSTSKPDTARPIPQDSSRWIGDEYPTLR